MNLTHQSNPSPTLRVGSFNVRCDFPGDRAQRWGNRKERLLDLLHHWEPDVIGFQEPLLFQLETLRQSLAAYESVGVGRDDGHDAGEFCPIFYRTDRFRLLDSGTFWFSETPQTPGSSDWGNRTTRLCTWVHLSEVENGAAFYFYNLHLDHESQSSREKSIQLLLSRIRERPAKDSVVKDPVIVVGDFNAEPDNRAIAAMSAADSPVPTSALATYFGETPGTFHGFTGEATGGPIDHIFLSPEWEVIEAEVLRGDGERPFISDHFPIAATLRKK